MAKNKRRIPELFQVGDERMTGQAFFDRYGTWPDPDTSIASAALDDIKDFETPRDLGDIHYNAHAVIAAEDTDPLERTVQDDITLLKHRKEQESIASYKAIMDAVSNFEPPASKITGERIDRTLKLGSPDDITSLNKITDTNKSALLKSPEIYQGTSKYKRPTP